MTFTLAAVVLGLLWFSLRYAWWRPAADEAWPRILMYHMIASPRAGARFNGLRVSPAMFERQLRWLRQNGWQSFTVSELVESAGKLPAKSFAITFDDGYADNLLQALPLLKKYRCKATLYLVVDRFDRDWSVVRKSHHDSGELLQEPKLSDAQVQTLLDSGCFELGSHSMTHPDFSRLDAATARHELADSRQVLSRRFGVEVSSFAWPFGLYRPEQVAMVREAGYASAVTTAEGIESSKSWRPLQLKRIKISGKDNWLAFRLRMRHGQRGWHRNRGEGVKQPRINPSSRRRPGSMRLKTLDPGLRRDDGNGLTRGSLNKYPTAPLRVWVLSDGQPGHFNLSRGIVAAVERVRPVEVHWLDLSLRVGLARSPMRFLLNHWAPPSPRWLKLFYSLPALPPGRCDLVVSAGGKTSFANAWLARCLGVKNIFAGSLRRLSPALFDVVVTLEPILPASPNNLVPDLPPSAIEADAVQHQGQVLRQELGLGEEKLWTLMLGGDGAGYRYHDADWRQLARLLEELGRLYNRRWLLLGSRRTGREAERLLQTSIDKSCVAATYWYGSGGDSVVEACLGAAERVFVTEDSMTMLTEAISSRRPVVSLRPAQVAPTGRYAAMIDRFEQHGWLARHAIGDLAAAPQSLEERPCRILAASPQENLASQLASRLHLDKAN